MMGNGWRRRGPGGKYLPLVLAATALVLAVQCSEMSPRRVGPSRETLFVANSASNYVTIYDLNSNGDAAPIANIDGTALDRFLGTLYLGGSGLDEPTGIAVDPTGNIYVSNLFGGWEGHGKIVAFSPGSSGSKKPRATIAGPNTRLESRGIAVDRNGNIYPASQGSLNPEFPAGIYVYTHGADGDVEPSMQIAGPHTGITNPEGVAVDSKGNILVTSNSISTVGGVSVKVFRSGTNGDIPPTAVLSGPSGFRLGAIAVDSKDNIYVAALGPQDSQLQRKNKILVYAAADRADTIPIASIGGPHTDLNGSYTVRGLAVDSRGDVYVAGVEASGAEADRVLIFAAGSNGDVPPRAIIEGPHTMLNGAYGIAIGPYPQPN